MEGSMKTRITKVEGERCQVDEVLRRCSECDDGTPLALAQAVERRLKTLERENARHARIIRLLEEDHTRQTSKIDHQEEENEKLQRVVAAARDVDEAFTYRPHAPMVTTEDALNRDRRDRVRRDEAMARLRQALRDLSVGEEPEPNQGHLAFQHYSLWDAPIDGIHEGMWHQANRSGKSSREIAEGIVLRRVEMCQPPPDEEQPEPEPDDPQRKYEEKSLQWYREDFERVQGLAREMGLTEQYCVLDIVKELQKYRDLWDWFEENCHYLAQNTNGKWYCWHQDNVDDWPEADTPPDAVAKAREVEDE